MRKSLAAMVVIASFFTAAPKKIRAQELGRDVTVWTWQGRVDQGRWFKLSSVNGPVTVESSNDGLIHVRAEKIPHRDGDIRDVRFAVVQSGGDVRICALWYDRDECDQDGLHSEGDRGRRRNRDVEVRFTVRVPRGVNLEAGTVNGSMSVRDVAARVNASTVNGGVEVRNAAGEVRATTVNGTVDVTTSSGPVNATTVNGDVNARMLAMSNDRDMTFNTVNGTIRVETPSALNAEVRMETLHGSISTDYPVTISGRFGPRHAEGTIGRGGQRIRMETVNGSIALVKAR
jgi:putative adhesin